LAEILTERFPTEKSFITLGTGQMFGRRLYIKIAFVETKQT